MTGGSRTICVVCGPGSIPACQRRREAHETCWGVWTRCPTCSGVQANQRSGMTGVFGSQGKTPTAGREAIRLVAGLINSARQVRRFFVAENEVVAKKRPSVLEHNADALHRAQPRGAISGLGRTKSRGYCVHFRRYPEGRAVLVADPSLARSASDESGSDRDAGPAGVRCLCEASAVSVRRSRGPSGLAPGGAAGFIRSRQFSTVGTKR